MSPIHLGSPTPFIILQNDTGQPIAQPLSQTQHDHPGTLTPALLSPNAQLALDQVEAQPNGHHQLLALLARNAIADNAVHIKFNSGTDAHYTQDVNIPGGEVANLTIRARLNDQNQYDIVGIKLHNLTSGKIESIYLSGHPAADARDNASTSIDQRHGLISTQLAAHYSRSQLAGAIIRLVNTQDFTGPPLPSGVSISTQSMVFSHIDSGAGESVANSSGPSRSRTTQNARVEPYLTSTGSVDSGSMQPKQRQRLTDEQIRAHLKNPDGTFRNQLGVANALKAEGFVPRTDRIKAQLQAAGVAQRRSATDEQIREHLESPGGTWRSHKDVVSALNDAGLKTTHERISYQRRAAVSAHRKLSSTNE